MLSIFDVSQFRSIVPFRVVWVDTSVVKAWPADWWTAVKDHCAFPPVDRRVVKFQPVVTKENLSLAQICDTKFDSLGVRTDSELKDDRFRDRTISVETSISIVDWDRAKQLPGVEAVISDELHIYT